MQKHSDPKISAVGQSGLCRETSWELLLFRAERSNSKNHTNRIPSDLLWSIIHNQITRFSLSHRFVERIFQLSDFSTLGEALWDLKMIRREVEKNFDACEMKLEFITITNPSSIVTPVTTGLENSFTFTSWLIRSGEHHQKRESDRNLWTIDGSRSGRKKLPWERFLCGRQKKFLLISLLPHLPSAKTCQSRAAHEYGRPQIGIYDTK